MRGYVEASCAVCPHLDRFQHTCEHPDRQVAIKALSAGRRVCPLYDLVRVEAMNDLERRLERVRDGDDGRSA